MNRFFKLIHCSLIHSAMKCVHVVLKLTIQANTVIKYSGIFTTTMFIFFLLYWCNNLWTYENGVNFSLLLDFFFWKRKPFLLYKIIVTVNVIFYIGHKQYSCVTYQFIWSQVSTAVILYWIHVVHSSRTLFLYKILDFKIR